METRQAKKRKTDDVSRDQLLQKVKDLGLPEYLKQLDTKAILFIVKQAGEIKKKDAKLEEHGKISMKHLIQHPPTIELKSVGPRNSNAGKSKHPIAKPTVVDGVELSRAKDDIDENVDLDDPSSLLLKLKREEADAKNRRKNRRKNNTEKGKTPSGRYITEGDVSEWVAAALGDAKQLVQRATGRVFSVHHEFSLWSDRPDHIVLIDEERQDPIIAVEDKKPFVNGITDHVHGQMFDYLMELRCLGHSAPFAVLSNVNESWLFWGNDEGSNDIVKLTSEMRLEKCTKAKIDEAQTQTQPPPDFTNEPPQELTNESTFTEIDRGEAGMCTTKPYGSKDLVSVLYTGIICGLALNPTARAEKYASDEERKSYDGIALCLEETTYKWGKLKYSLDSPIVAEGCFFALKMLGRGNTSKVFDAYDGKGNRCAIKMFVKRDKKEDGILQSKNESKNTGIISCEREVERLQTCYPFLEDKVYFQELNTFPCVIMPCFRPVSKEEREKFRDHKKGKLRDELRGCLLKLANEGLKYEESDLRWRHIGYYKEIKNKKEQSNGEKKTLKKKKKKIENEQGDAGHVRPRRHGRNRGRREKTLFRRSGRKIGFGRSGRKEIENGNEEIEKENKEMLVMFDLADMVEMNEEEKNLFLEDPKEMNEQIEFLHERLQEEQTTNSEYAGYIM